LSTHPHGELSRGRVSYPPLALCPCPAGWSHHLVGPVHKVQSRIHGPPAFRPALSLDATREGPRRLVSDAWRAQFGTGRGGLPSRPDSPLPPGLYVWPPGAGDRPDAVWPALAHLLPG